MPHELAGLIPLLRKRNGAITAIELGVESRARQPLPVTDIARGFVIDQPLLKHFGAAFPVDVAAPARQEASDGVAAEVVDPAFGAELAHQGVDPGKACAAVFPALEPLFGLRAIDCVFACDETGLGVDFGGEVPWYEAAVGVIVGLAEVVTQGGLGAEVHVSEEELAC